MSVVSYIVVCLMSEVRCMCAVCLINVVCHIYVVCLMSVVYLSWDCFLTTPPIISWDGWTIDTEEAFRVRWDEKDGALWENQESRC